jgi:ligand-binding SRPBCC domain-containing protein
MYQLKRTQFVKTDLETCWDFFSSPDNLSKITPDYMGFDVLTDVPNKMYEGLIIAYRVRPLMNIPMKWVTEITHVKNLEFFVDEQRKGPYTMWHHEHHFKAVDGGVEMTDIVSYIVPFGWLGRLIHPIIVRKKLEEIFDYRFKVVEDMFNSKE